MPRLTQSIYDPEVLGQEYGKCDSMPGLSVCSRGPYAGGGMSYCKMLSSRCFTELRLVPINYYALWGYFNVIPQDPGPLLDILPSPELTLYSLLKVFWLGARPPKDSDLSPFLLVRRTKVLAAL